MAEVAEGEVAQPMVAPGGRRGRKLEVRETQFRTVAYVNRLHT
jgi:hypothetical protein